MWLLLLALLLAALGGCAAAVCLVLFPDSVPEGLREQLEPVREALLPLRAALEPLLGGGRGKGGARRPSKRAREEPQPRKRSVPEAPAMVEEHEEELPEVPWLGKSQHPIASRKWWEERKGGSPTAAAANNSSSVSNSHTNTDPPRPKSSKTVNAPLPGQNLGPNGEPPHPKSTKMGRSAPLPK
jgi:hypothetical protein